MTGPLMVAAQSLRINRACAYTWGAGRLRVPEGDTRPHWNR
jgi:hypothetical protein